jgi:hypothetical protein
VGQEEGWVEEADSGEVDPQEFEVGSTAWEETDSEEVDSKAFEVCSTAWEEADLDAD